jgi:hypothetical protein
MSCGARTSPLLGGYLATDASVEDAPLDVTPDVVAADVAPDSPVPPGCDAGAREVWLLSDLGQLFGFYPETLTVEARARVNCGPPLNSMTVSRRNVGYASAHEGGLFTVDLLTGFCMPTPFDPVRYGITSYGMGFVADPVPAGERLYVVPHDALDRVNILGTIDVYGTFDFTEIGRFEPPLPPTEVSGTSDGRLYAVHVGDASTNGEAFLIDKTSGAVLDRFELPIDRRVYHAFHFAFWRGSFYIFIAYETDLHSRVIRYTPGDRQAEEIAIVEPIVVGAGVSTCAPL